MSPDLLTPFCRGSSPCHRWPAESKLLFTLGLIAVSLVIPVPLWPLSGVLAGFLLGLLALARIPFSYVAIRTVSLLLFVGCVAAAFPLSRGTAGLEQAAGVLLRATVAFLASLWLVNTTPFDRLLQALLRLGMPRLIVMLLAFKVRYLGVLFDELHRMRTARRARTFTRTRLAGHWLLSGQLLGQLLIRAMNRAERVHGAMLARGWTGIVRLLDDPAPSASTTPQ